MIKNNKRVCLYTFRLESKGRKKIKFVKVTARNWRSAMIALRKVTEKHQFTFSNLSGKTDWLNELVSDENHF